MLLHTGLPIAIILTSRILCIIFLLITSLIHFQVVANTLFSNNDSKSIPHAQSFESSSGRQIEATLKLKPASSSLKMRLSPLKPISSPNNRTKGERQISMSYDVESWLPKEKKSVPVSKVNLTILPVLAMLSFLIALCLKFCSWFRESGREKESGSGFDENYFIIQHGDEEYMDVDFRSDTSTPYDTVSSYTSYIRAGSNYNTWNSVRSVQVVHPTNMQALYKAFLMHRRERERTESINSYRTSVKKAAVLKDMEVQVELMNSNEENLKQNEKSSSTEEKRKKNWTKDRGTKDTSKKPIETGNVFFISKGNGTVLKNDQIVSPVDGEESVDVSSINSKKNLKDNGNHSEDSSNTKCQKKHQRFNVSFVTDGSGNVVSSSQRNESTATTNTDSPTHSPSSILSNSNI